MRIGEVYRYARPYREVPAEIDGYPNYFAAVFGSDLKLPLLEHGINPIKEVWAPDGVRRPAILVSSSPHKIGSKETPWQDFFDSDNGHIRYYGDNKEPDRDPGTAPGNRVLLQAYGIHNVSDLAVRRRSPPLVFFERVSKGGRKKGFVKFQGFGVVERVELITQYDRNRERTFSNYAFDFAVLSLMEDDEEFDWSWINDRRNPGLKVDETLGGAPHSWKQWIAGGPGSLDRFRRHVSKLMTLSPEEQRGSLMDASSREAQALSEVYKFYTGRKRCFEALAAVVAEQVIVSSGGHYRFGWITRPPDGGADFVGRLNVGSGFGAAKLVVLGQAKCERPDVPTSGNHIARTVARLKRGWIGVYVTTSYFSDAVQREIIEDDYPLVLINGKRLAEEVLRLAHQRGKSVRALLEMIEDEFKSKVQIRRPEEVLRC